MIENNLKKISDSKGGNSLKSSRIAPYYDMESRERYEEKLYRKYMEKQGLTDGFLVSNKLKEIIDNYHPFLVEFIEKKYRERFNRYFEDNPAISELLEYTNSTSLIKIASDMDQWMESLKKRGINRKLSFQLFRLLNELSKSALIFEYLEERHRIGLDFFLSNNLEVQELIPRNLYLNLIDLSSRKKIIIKNIKSWQDNEEKKQDIEEEKLNYEEIRKEFKSLLNDVESSCKTLRYLDLIDVAKLVDNIDNPRDDVESSISMPDAEKREKKSSGLFKIHIDKKLFLPLPIFGLLLISILLIISPSTFMFAEDVLIAFRIAQVFIVFMSFYFYSDKEIFKKIFAKKEQKAISQKKSRKKTNFSLRNAYNRHKNSLFGISLLFLSGLFVAYFIYEPQHLFIPVFLVLVAIFLFTLDDKKKKVGDFNCDIFGFYAVVVYG